MSHSAWRISHFLMVAIAMLASAQAVAWGDLGHRVTALVAYRHMTPKARLALDAMLASDRDTLTPPDFASRTTWADKYRDTHRETATWHFVDIEIDHPDLKGACFGFPALGETQLASQGPAQDCVVNKIDEFAAELKNPATPPAERLLALKFLIHFIGDLHQPLHAADHSDRGGNCIGLAPPIGGAANLHAYWDVAVIDVMGTSAEQIADRLDSTLTVEQIKDWTAGTPRSWAIESFELGRRDVYALPARPTCQAGGSIALSDEYQAQARTDAAPQLLKAAVRMANLLNEALGS
ncbi:MAG TPA: S1/P1 nuclease [Steroidobacteraceae bacterium]